MQEDDVLNEFGLLNNRYDMVATALRRSIDKVHERRSWVLQNRETQANKCQHHEDDICLDDKDNIVYSDGEGNVFTYGKEPIATISKSD
jgi:hypothetical protein